MKFVCEGVALADAAFTVSKACSIKTTSPILECIKLEAQNDSLTLTAYDGEISIKKTMKAEILEEGEICVNGKFFADFIGKISTAEIVISTKDNSLYIEYGDSETFMQSLNADEFPVFIIGDLDREKYVDIKQSELKELISKVVFCCASDESRPILRGCLLEAKEGKLTATALDGFRMATSYCSTSGGADMKIVCPARTLNEIARMLDGNDEDIRIFADKNRLNVSLNNTVITSRLYVGEFVKKENIFPAAFATQITVRKSELIQTVERAAVLTRGDKNNLVLFDMSNSKILITANSDMGKVEETVVADMSGDDLKIAMNGKYLLDALKAIGEENVVISFNTSVSPFTLEGVEEKRNQYLILPVRTSASA